MVDLIKVRNILEEMTNYPTGAFNRDPLTFCHNVVESMRKLAGEALKEFA